MSSLTRIFLAKRIITMHPEQPLATAVAAKEGRFLAAGELEDVIFWLRRQGVSRTFHNDPPGAPQLLWIAAWTAVQRKTMESETVLGPEHRGSVEEAL